MIFDATVDGRTIRVEVKGGAGRYTVSLDGTPLELSVASASDGLMSLLIAGESHELGLERLPEGFRVVFPDGSISVELSEAARNGTPPARRDHGPMRVTAPMPGRIVRVLAAAGSEVAAGQGLVVIEAMKMENELRTPRSGRLQEVLVREGQAVEAGALLAVVT